VISGLVAGAVAGNAFTTLAQPASPAELDSQSTFVEMTPCRLVDTRRDEPAVVSGQGKLGQSESRTYSGLAVISPDRRRALLDAPIAARRTVYALLNDTTSELTAEGYDPAYIELIHSTYIDNIDEWRESWTSGAFILQRRLLHLILEQPNPADGVAITTAVSKLGVKYESLVALSSTRNNIPPAVSRNWTQRTAIGRADRLLIPKACPWSDCLGNLPQRQHPATPGLATHYLHVPELPGGLLCRQCRRIPDQTQPFAAARFPDDYLRPYRRRTNKEDGTRTGSRIETASWAAATST